MANTASNTFTLEIEDLVGIKAGATAFLSPTNKDALVRHGAPQGLYDPDITRENLRQIIILRYQVAHFFNELFEKLGRGVDKNHKDKPELSEAITENLSEEKGESGEMEHGSARKVLLTKLGIDADEWSNQNGTLEHIENVDHRVRAIVEKIRSLIEENTLQGYGAMTYWEARGAQPETGDQTLLLRAFEAKYPEFKKEDTNEPGKKGKYEPGDALYHLESHAILDVEHSKMLINALSASVHTEEEIESVLFGMRTAHLAWQQFWESIP